jgi:serpin B
MCDLYAPETLDNINQWVAKHTDGMITNLLNPEDLQPNLVSFLLNAISFKGAWAKPFDKDLTESAPFDGGKATAMMMSQKSEFQYAESSLYQAVRLRYGNGAYFLTVFLPRENQTLDNLVSALNGQNWNNANYERCQVSLKLPRITTDTNQDLNDAMSALGMPDAFLDEKDAEGFTQLCYLGNDEANSDRVWIGLMKQSASLTLDEAGTQAAAATAIEVVGKSAPIGPQVDFVADRPFLYTLSEESTGAIFFIGQYLGDGPAQSGEQNAIHDILKTNGAADAKAYDLQGREAAPQSKGLLIRDGRKIVKK